MSRNKVLVVDDESGVRFGIRDFLEQHGYEIEEADSCQDAQHLFRTSRPDIVIADYMLPDGTALDLLPRLREIDAGIPLLVLTAHGSIDPSHTQRARPETSSPETRIFPRRADC